MTSVSLTRPLTSSLSNKMVHHVSNQIFFSLIMGENSIADYLIFLFELFPLNYNIYMLQLSRLFQNLNTGFKVWEGYRGGY